MKVILFGRNLDLIRPTIIKAGFKIVKSKPDFVISYGGDGTLMQSEHKFPGIPKIILKGSLICKKASCFTNEDVLKKISAPLSGAGSLPAGRHGAFGGKKGNFKIKSYFKLEAIAGNKKIIAVNDIVLHNKNARHAIRYRVWINGREVGKEVIGDGAVIATPFGSTAYYRSITDSFFELGIGLAFNNSTEQSDHMVLKEDSEIKIKIVRGPAVVYGDNQEDHIDLLNDSELTVKRSDKVMRVVNLI